MVLKDHTSSVANPGHLLPWNKNQHKYSDLNNTCAVSISLGEELSMAQRPSTRGPTEWPSKCWPGLGLLPGSPLLQVHLAGDRIQFLVSQDLDHSFPLEATFYPLSWEPLHRDIYPSKPAEELMESLSARLKTWSSAMLSEVTSVIVLVRSTPSTTHTQGDRGHKPQVPGRGMTTTYSKGTPRLEHLIPVFI